jgi:predicted phosphoadenosine phosphosulfate sulfurtransferase
MVLMQFIVVKHIVLFIINLIKNDQWACSIFDMLYLPWSGQKMIKDRNPPPQIGIIGEMQKHAVYYRIHFKFRYFRKTFGRFQIEFRTIVVVY